MNFRKLQEAEIEEESKKIKEAEEKERKAVLKSRYAQVPDRYKSSTLDSIETMLSRHQRNIICWSMGASAIIYGGYGCGKTHLGWALCKNRWDMGDDALYSTAQSIYADIKRQFGVGDPDLVIQRYQTVPIWS